MNRCVHSFMHDETKRKGFSSHSQQTSINHTTHSSKYNPGRLSGEFWITLKRPVLIFRLIDSNNPKQKMILALWRARKLKIYSMRNYWAEGDGRSSKESGIVREISVCVDLIICQRYSTVKSPIITMGQKLAKFYLLERFLVVGHDPGFQTSKTFKGGHS